MPFKEMLKNCKLRIIVTDNLVTSPSRSADRTFTTVKPPTHRVSSRLVGVEIAGSKAGGQDADTDADSKDLVASGNHKQHTPESPPAVPPPGSADEMEF